MRALLAIVLLAGLTSCDGLTQSQRERASAEAYAANEMKQFRQTPEQAAKLIALKAEADKIAADWYRDHPKSMTQVQAEAADLNEWAAEQDAEARARQACLDVVSTSAGIAACTR